MPKLCCYTGIFISNLQIFNCPTVVLLQARQLPLLAPVLPTKQPLLHAQCYDMVLQVSTQCTTIISVVGAPASQASAGSYAVFRTY